MKAEITSDVRGRRDGDKAGCRRPWRGFTLVELLVVIAIIALLVGILTPSLQMARELALCAVCASNQHQVYLAAGYYGRDYGGYMGPPTLEYKSLVYNRGNAGVSSDCRPLPVVPPQLSKVGFDHPNKSPADFYCALGYIGFERQARFYRNSRGEQINVMGNEVLTCPVAVSRLEGPIFRSYGWQVPSTGSYMPRLKESDRYGDVECHFFWSGLMYYRDPRRFPILGPSTYGPCRLSEIPYPSDLLLLGDGIAERNGPHSFLGENLDVFQVGLSILYCGYNDFVPWFGYAIEHSWADGKQVKEMYSYHRTAPNGAFWDGHVESLPAPSDESDRRDKINSLLYLEKQ